MWDFLCLFANNTGKTRDHRNRILGSGITICVFDRSIGKLISIDSLSGKLVLLYWDQASEEDSSVVSEIFTCFCNFSLYFHAGNQAALYHRCVWRDHFKWSLLSDRKKDQFVSRTLEGVWEDQPTSWFREKICEIQRKIIGDQRVGKMKNKKKVIGNTVFFFALFGLTAYAVLKERNFLSWRKF